MKCQHELEQTAPQCPRDSQPLPRDACSQPGAGRTGAGSQVLLAAPRGGSRGGCFRTTPGSWAVLEAGATLDLKPGLKPAWVHRARGGAAVCPSCSPHAVLCGLILRVLCIASRDRGAPGEVQSIPQGWDLKRCCPGAGCAHAPKP